LAVAKPRQTAGTKSATERKETHLTEDAPGFTPDDPQEAWQKFTDTMRKVVTVPKEAVEQALADEQEERQKGRGK
jgi:hypothetical protein